VLSNLGYYFIRPTQLQSHHHNPKNRVYLVNTSKFELNFNTNSKNENPNLDQVFLYLDNNFGRFEFGNFVAVNQKMKYVK
jgi:hypothetical protein